MRRRWQRVWAALLVVLAVFLWVLPAAARSRSFGGGFSSGSRGFASAGRSFSSRPPAPSRSFSAPRPSPAPPVGRSSPEFSAPARSFSSAGPSFSTRRSDFSTGDRGFSSGRRDFRTPAPPPLRPGTTGTVTAGGRPYPYRADSEGRPVIQYDVGRSRYPDRPPVVVVGTPPLDPWVYQDMYWGMPWWQRIWFRPVYSYYSPWHRGFALSPLAYVAAAAGVVLVGYLFMLWARRRYFGGV